MGEDLRYLNGKIYFVINVLNRELCYVGSTINGLDVRFINHKQMCRGGGKLVSLYHHIVDNDWSNWRIVLFEDFPCSNRKELERREGEIIRQFGTINKCIAGRTMKEYYLDNIEKFKERDRIKYIKNSDYIKKQKKEYYQRNREFIKAKNLKSYHNKKLINTSSS